MNSDYKLSIISINYNNSSGLKNTLESLKNQIFSEFELVIVDGESTDNSMEIVSKYSEMITTIISEKDRGIYDAMNKGIKSSTGDFLCFLNSGDILSNKHSIKNALDSIDNMSTGYFFNAIVKSNNSEYKSPKRYEKERYVINAKFIPNHQAVFFPRVFYSNNLYQTNLTICSDVDYIFRLANSFGIVYRNQNFVFFELGGVSSSFKRIKKTFTQIRESSFIFRRYKPLRLDIQFYIVIKFILKYTLHNLFGNNYFKILKRINGIKQALTK